jgi:predicted RNase H-like nuclease (RuvC/YqgF family)
MKGMSTETAAGWAAVPPMHFELPGRSGLLILLLFGLLIPTGCGDRDTAKARKEGSDARAAVARLELQLTAARDEIAAMKAELKAVRQTRDDLQQQIDQIKQERDQASGLAQQANELIKQVTAKADGQAGTTVALQKQIADLKALVKEQQAMIEELKNATAQPVEATEKTEDAGTQPPPVEPNEKP